MYYNHVTLSLTASCADLFKCNSLTTKTATAEKKFILKLLLKVWKCNSLHVRDLRKAVGKLSVNHSCQHKADIKVFKS